MNRGPENTSLKAKQVETEKITNENYIYNRFININIPEVHKNEPRLVLTSISDGSANTILRWNVPRHRLRPALVIRMKYK